MSGEADLRRYGEVFDTVAAEYDRNRPSYPDELIDQACRLGGLSAGDRVLEIGCGTGQLTRSLVARGLHVTAVEPGENLIALAGRLDGPGALQFVNRRFEDASLDGGFSAVFSASAFHWLDPDVSWGKVAHSLAPGGLLALIQYCGAREDSTSRDADALMAALARVAPEIAADWPALRDVETILSGAAARRQNVSDVWAWVGTQAVARSYAATLFDDAEIAVKPTIVRAVGRRTQRAVCHHFAVSPHLAGPAPVARPREPRDRRPARWRHPLEHAGRPRHGPAGGLGADIEIGDASSQEAMLVPGRRCSSQGGDAVPGPRRPICPAAARSHVRCASPFPPVRRRNRATGRLRFGDGFGTVDRFTGRRYVSWQG